MPWQQQYKRHLLDITSILIQNLCYIDKGMQTGYS